ncbi:MAG: DUF4097 family beta strand repeat-containing protein [Bulleidia sp.]
MKYITEHITKTFAKYPSCAETEDLQKEILQNCTERFEDCLKAGMNETEAERSVMDSLGDLDTLITAITAEQPEFRPVKAEESSSSENEGEIRTVQVSVISSDVVLTSSNTDEITVNAPDYVRHNQIGDTIVVEEEAQFHGFFSQGVVRISLPEHFDTVSVRSKSGDITAEKIVADHITLITMSGDIEGTFTGRTVQCTSISGDLDVRALGYHGTWKSSTTSGDVDLDLMGYETMEISATSGDIDLNIHEDFMSCSARSVSGDVDIHVREVAGVDASMKSTSGDCRCSAQRVTGKNRIEAKTISGDVSIKA